MKVKLNQFDELKQRFKANREAKKPFQSVGNIAINEGRKRTPPKAKCAEMYNESGFFNPDYTDLWI